MDGKRVCFGFCSNLILRTKVTRLLLFGRWVDGVSAGELADCVSVSGSVSDSVCCSIASPHSKSEMLSVTSQTSQLICGVLQTLSSVEKRGASGSLLSTAKSAPPKRTLVKAEPQCLRN